MWLCGWLGSWVVVWSGSCVVVLFCGWIGVLMYGCAVCGWVIEQLGGWWGNYMIGGYIVE